MTKYNKQAARELYKDLQEHLKGTPERIEKATDEGPVIDLICKALGAAISALKHGPQEES
jgi:hypothetical protein